MHYRKSNDPDFQGHNGLSNRVPINSWTNKNNPGQIGSLRYATIINKYRQVNVKIFTLTLHFSWKKCLKASKRQVFFINLCLTPLIMFKTATMKSLTAVFVACRRIPDRRNSRG